jgi:light-regulated signal transduction histidine kinase (bacteriophytochrome)
MNYLEKLKQLESDDAKTNADWLTAWRELAAVTYGITDEDPRFEPVLRWLNACDVAFALDSWAGFYEAAEAVKRVAKGLPP